MPSRKMKKSCKIQTEFSPLVCTKLSCRMTGLDAVPCKLVYAVLKIDLIQKQSGAQRHHLLCFLRQIITNIVSTMHPATKAQESYNSIQYGTLVRS